MSWILSTHPAGSLTFFSRSDMCKGLWTHRWYRLSIPKGVGPLRMAPWFLEIHLWKFCDIYFSIIYLSMIYHLSCIIDQNLSRIICQLVTIIYELISICNHRLSTILSSIIYHWSSIIYHLSSIVYHLSPIIRYLSSLLDDRLSIIYYLSTTLLSTMYFIDYLSSIIYPLSSII